MNSENSFLQIGEPYRRKIGKVTFEVSSFCRKDGGKTAEELLLELIGSKVAESISVMEKEAFYDRT